MSADSAKPTGCQAIEVPDYVFTTTCLAPDGERSRGRLPTAPSRRSGPGERSGIAASPTDSVSNRGMAAVPTWSAGTPMVQKHPDRVTNKLILNF